MNNQKLLIIEDDDVYASALKRRLEKNGFSCILANNASDALLHCHQFRPAYILLDMKLDKDNGLALIKPIKHLLAKSRLILLTGFASIATAVEAIKLGADDYLTKPIDTQTLLTALNGSRNVSDTIDNTLSAEQAEWQHIQQVLKFNQGNVSATARQLSMHRRTLQRKLQKKPSF